MKKLIFMVVCVLFASTTVYSQNIECVMETASTKLPKTAIIYCSNFGTTGKVANMIADRIASDNDVTVISLTDNPTPDISDYDKIILGNSVFMGKTGNNMLNFCYDNKEALENKTIALYSCGVNANNGKKREEPPKAFPEDLYLIAKADGFMGGEYDLEGVSAFRKRMIKRVAKADLSKSKIDYDNLEQFSLTIK